MYFLSCSSPFVSLEHDELEAKKGKIALAGEITDENLGQWFLEPLSYENFYS